MGERMMTTIHSYRITLFVYIVLLGNSVGCGTKTETGSQNQSALPQVNGTTTGNTRERLANSPSLIDPKYLQPFHQATITNSIPEDQLAPPDKTLTGKSTGIIREAIETMWPKIALTDREGKPIDFIVSVETSEGSFEIMLKPEIAPNHVRNFIALIKASFYNGLVFDRQINQEYLDTDGQVKKLSLIRGGCPIGIGDPGIGHLGYFMKPEFSSTAKHEEGTVGFWRDSFPETAGCRFYIMTTSGPTLDGEYTIVGKVTKGLEIVKKISSMPKLNSENPIDNEKPKTPVVIKKMEVSPDTLESISPLAQNSKIRNDH
jgi:peptidyl-prolyl cis-trans isomerase B (cyclophilin B)